MIPADFHTAYRSTANQVSQATGIDPIALLAQWANETAWGTVVVGNNLGNIRCSPTSFCQYATLADFAQACAATFHDGYYAAVLAATNAVDQLAAIVASPWSSGHYGGSLATYYAPLEEFELTPDEHRWLQAVYTVLSPVSLTQVLTAVNQVDADVKALCGPGGTEPPEPAEPKTITLNIPSVPGTATGTLS